MHTINTTKRYTKIHVFQHVRRVNNLGQTFKLEGEMF